MNLNKTNIYTCLFLMACAISSAFSSPRADRVLVDIAHGAITIARNDVGLCQRVKPLVGDDIFGSSGADLKQKLKRLPRSVLEHVRDMLTPVHRRILIANQFNDFFNPSGDNVSYGTYDYAMILEELIKASDRSNAELVAFEANHRQFCQVFRAQANAGAARLGWSLKSAYEQVRDNNTKAAVKPVLSRIGFGSLGVVNKRISNNALNQ